MRSVGYVNACSMTVSKLNSLSMLINRVVAFGRLRLWSAHQAAPTPQPVECAQAGGLAWGGLPSPEPLLLCCRRALKNCSSAFSCMHGPVFPLKLSVDS